MDTAVNASWWSFAEDEVWIADSPDGYWSTFAGSIEDVRIYNYPISKQKIEELYRSGP